MAGIAGPGERQQRRAEGRDSMSYGLAGTLGPAAVAALAAVVPLTLPSEETPAREERRRSARS